ncbi:MAG: hypothetical protein IKV30_02910 [Clostridia bacterium]|nr:hypothetical protein [Clostridia bacterium]
MKKRLFIFVISVLVILSFSACQNSSVDSAPTPTPTYTPTATATPEPINIADIQGVSFDLDLSPYQGKELDYCLNNVDKTNIVNLSVIKVDNTHIGVISNSFVENSKGISSNYQIDIYDLLTGQMVGSRSYSSNNCHVFVEGSKILIFDCSTGVLHTFPDYTLSASNDIDLSQILPKTNGYDELGNETFSYCENAMQYMDNKLYYIYAYGLYSLNLDTLTTQNVITPDTNGAASMGFFTKSPSGQAFCVTFSVYGQTTEYFQYSVDSNGNVKELSAYGNPLYFGQNDHVMSYSYKENKLTKYNGTNITNILFPHEQNLEFVVDEYAFSYFYDFNFESFTPNNIMYVYDIESGDLILSQVTGESTSSVILMPEKSIIIYTTYDNKVFAIPLSKEMVSENGKDALAFEEDILTTKDTNLQLAKNLELKYGITIGIYENGIKSFADFTAMQNNNHLAIRDALRNLDATLSKFPEGFIQELTSFGLLTKLEVLFTGQMTPTNEFGTSNPVAFAVSNYGTGTKYLIFNIDDVAFSRTVAHELMHYIEDQILYAGTYLNKGDSFSRWSQLNPAGFSYNYSYVDWSGYDYSDTTYCYGYNSPDYAYFVDAYSKTFPWEDRARLLEYLLSDDPELLNVFDCDHIKYKVEYLIEVIDAVFETWNDSHNFGTTQWN